MPSKLEVKRKLNARSERVKSVDLHPTEPWVISSLYNGNVLIWDYKTETAVKTFEVSELPTRCAKFVARKQWMICASDDMMIRVYNYNSMAKLHSFEAHTDYIRCLAVHPTQPFVLSCSDDMLIKLWNWDKDFQCSQIFEGHNHYVMQVTFNPKDSNTFASASLDRSIKIWNVSSPVPNYSLDDHERGVNSVDYFLGPDKPYLVSGSDDRTVKVWDYLNKSCLQTLEGHSHNVSAVRFHPTLPLLLTGSEDSTVRIWNANTYRLEKTLNYGMDRVWALSTMPKSNNVAIAYDEGTVMIKFGSEEPSISMDKGGKIIWSRQNSIQQVNTKTLKPADLQDGEKITLSTKELGTSEVFPQSLKHNSNGRFVVVTGDGEFIIYTALAWRNKSYGKALEFVWGNDTGEYATRESSSKICISKNFKEVDSFRPQESAEGIFAGRLLAVRSNSSLSFHDWADCKLICKIEIVPKSVHWSDSGEFVVIGTESSFFLLRFDAEKVDESFSNGEVNEETGVEDAFEVLHEIQERIRAGMWIGDCFIYTNANRLNYCVGGEIVTLAHIEGSMYPIGYSPKQSRVYCADKSANIVSYSLDLSIINYQTSILREDFEAAEGILPKIPESQRNRIAQFLEKQGHLEMALEVATDQDLQFSLSLQLNKLSTAFKIAKESDDEDKWRQLGNSGLKNGELGLARQCLLQANDLGGLLALCTASGDVEGLELVAGKAREEGLYNISFISYFSLGKIQTCLDLLCEAGRAPEAAFLARTYMPSKISEMVALWREDLKKDNAKAADSLADPNEYPNLFPELEHALVAERILQAASQSSLPASDYLKEMENRKRDFIKEVSEGTLTSSNLPTESTTTTTTTITTTTELVPEVTAAPVDVEPEVEVVEEVEVESDPTPEVESDPIPEVEEEVEEEEEATLPSVEDSSLDLEEELAGDDEDSLDLGDMEGLDGEDIDLDDIDLDLEE